MTPTRDQAIDAIFRLGYEESLEDVCPEVWLQLATLGVVEGGTAISPTFTERGWSVYAAMEGGDDD